MPHVRVFVEREKKEHDINAISIDDIFSKLKINPETVLVVLNDELVTSKASLQDGDRVLLVSVISGG